MNELKLFLQERLKIIERLLKNCTYREEEDRVENANLQGAIDEIKITLTKIEELSK